MVNFEQMLQNGYSANDLVAQIRKAEANLAKQKEDNQKKELRAKGERHLIRGVELVCESLDMELDDEEREILAKSITDGLNEISKLDGLLKDVTPVKSKPKTDDETLEAFLKRLRTMN